eukprot:Em0008g371a
MSAEEILGALSAANSGNLTALIALGETLNLSECYDKYGASAVHYAVRGGKIDCLRWLMLSAGLSGNKPAFNGATPAHDAAATGQLDCLQWLVQNGVCSPNAKDVGGTTPLHLAATFDHLPTVVWLVESEHCSVSERAQSGITPVHLAAAKGSLKCLRWMAQHDPSCVNKRADNGTTPVYFAAQEGRLECLQYLATQVEANCRLRASDGMAPIHAAAQMGQLDCVAWLISKVGVSPMERDNDGATPLHFAAAKGHVHVMKWLLANGATIDRDDLGGTPLHDAAEHGSIEAVEVLLMLPNINKDECDEDGLTAADLAKDCGHDECAKFIKDYKPQPTSASAAVTESPAKYPNRTSLCQPSQSAIQTTAQLSARPASSPVGQIISGPVTEIVPQRVSSPTGQISTAFAEISLRKVSSPTSSGPITEIISPKVEFPKLKPVVLNAGEKDKTTTRETDELQTVFTRRGSTGQSYLDSTEDLSEDGSTENCKTQNSELMLEVREFELAALKAVPAQVQKRNLQPVILGRVVPSSGTKPAPESLKRAEGATVQLPSRPLEPISVAEDPHSNLPAWKRAIVKKKSIEQAQSLQAEKEKEEAEKNKWADVPAWKRAVMEKKETERKKREEQEVAARKLEEEKKLQFESLPAWKKQLILQHKKD